MAKALSIAIGLTERLHGGRAKRAFKAHALACGF
jgi:hypothetical protein